MRGIILIMNKKNRIQRRYYDKVQGLIGVIRINFRQKKKSIMK